MVHLVTEGNAVKQALKEGWNQGTLHVMAGGILTQAQEAKLRKFRDRLAAVAIENPESHRDELAQSLSNL